MIYMDYLKNKDRTRYANNADIENPKITRGILNLKEQGNFSDALTYINSDIYYIQNDDENFD